MATWQVDGELLPRSALAKPGDGSTEGERPPGAWQTPQDLAELRCALGEWLPRSQTDADLWGEVDGTCVQLTGDDQNGFDAFIRIDLRSATHQSIDHLLTVIHDCRLAIRFLETGEVYSRRDDIVRAIRTSSAAKFVKNPLGFIRELHEHG